MTAELLAAGWHFHRAGDLPRAELAYRQVLQKEPSNAQVWFLLGVLCQSRGDPQTAAANLEEALRLQPAHADALHLRGILFAQHGQLAEAADRFRRALQLKPDDAEIQTNLALALTKQGLGAEAITLLQAVLRARPDHAQAQVLLREVLAQTASAEGLEFLQKGMLKEAEARFRQALGHQPDAPDAHNNLGYTVARQGKLEEAIAHYRQALRLQSDFSDAHNNLGLAFRLQRKLADAEASFRAAIRHNPEMAAAHGNLGLVLLDQKRPAEAEASCRMAVSLQPEVAELHNNLGLALLDQKKPAEAEASCRLAIQIQPEMAEAHNALGSALIEQDRSAEALVSLQRAVELEPGSAEAHNNLGVALWRLGRLDEALASYAVALRLKPDYPDPHANAAVVRLLLGDYEEGWREYQWHRQTREFAGRAFTQPLWEGSPLAGRTILLYGEQGLGDTLQFVRYARLLRDQGATVILECQKKLLHLLACCPEIHQLVAQGDPLPPHDVRAPLMSLPYLFGTRLDTIPAKVPYLWADSALVEQWRRELAALPGIRIGITWQGNPKFDGDRQRSLPLAEFAPLAEVPGVQLVSLQHGPGSEQLNAMAGKWPVTDLGGRLDEAAGPFMDTAAVMTNLDLVVTSDTAIPHLAGALGVPVWVALAKVPDWRWLLEREDSPWYPSMRLFRQEQFGDWGPVFQRIAQAVRERVTR